MPFLVVNNVYFYKIFKRFCVLIATEKSSIAIIKLYDGESRVDAKDLIPISLDKLELHIDNNDLETKMIDDEIRFWRDYIVEKNGSRNVIDYY